MRLFRNCKYFSYLPVILYFVALFLIWSPNSGLTGNVKAKNVTPQANHGLRRHMHGIAGSDVTARAAQATPHSVLSRTKATRELARLVARQSPLVKMSF